MTSTTPRTLRNANYIVYTACAIGMAGLASVGLAMAMRDDAPLKPPAAHPEDPARSKSATQSGKRSRGATSKLDQEQNPTKLAETAPLTPKEPTKEAHTKPAVIPDDVTQKTPPQAASATITSTDAKPAPPPPLPAYSPATPAQRAEIVAAVERADRAEMKAMRTLDLSGLKSTHADRAYNIIRDEVANLKKQGFYVASEYAGAQVDSVKISADGLKAQVRTTETWESSWYSSATNVCKAHVHKRPVPQTVYLTRGKQGWVISDVKHDNPKPPPFVACHN